MSPHPRIITEYGQPTRLKVWDDRAERDLSFEVSMGELRNLVRDGLDVLLREMRRRERESP